MGWHIDCAKDKAKNWVFTNHWTEEEVGCGEYDSKGFNLLDYTTQMILPFPTAALAWKFLNERMIDQHGF